MLGFSIGNGNSRKNLDLELLKSKGIVYACNAIYRDFSPHTLVAVDEKMKIEIENSEYSGRCIFRGNINGNRKLIDGKTYYEDLGWASGPTATKLLSEQEKVNKIFLIGHDVQYNISEYNNVYAGTNNYNKIGSRPNVYKHFIDQLKNVFIENHKIDYYMVSDIDLPVIPSWIGISNLKYVSKNYLNEFLNCEVFKYE